MRYPAAHKVQTRERLLQSAAEAIRRDGPLGVGVAAVMADAGLTHGGFYAHFPSKDAFLAAAIERMFEDGADLIATRLQGRPPAEGLADYLDYYLSFGHRNATARGCPLPCLSPDAPRLSAANRARIALGVERLTQALSEALSLLGHAAARDKAGAMVSELVGAVILARAEPDGDRAGAILERTRLGLRARLGLTTASSPALACA
uniref:Transcriptional regulator, TetR family n=1 Tax=Caulobacter sp. (strain K31) TaxID=366602 RepID=B0T995_CAUSK